MKPTTPRALGVVALCATLFSCGSEPSPFARAYVIESLDEAIGGPKAIARPGDFVLENDHLRIAVLSARNSLGPGLYGGSLVDADIQRSHPAANKGHGRDQFAELFPTLNMNVAKPNPDDPDSVRIVSDGSDGGPAIVRMEGPAEPFLTLLGALWALLGNPQTWLTTDYIVEPGVPWVTLRTQASFGFPGAGELPAAEPVGQYTDGMPLLEWALESGAVMGEFYLSGGSVDVFAPGIGFDEDGAVYESMQRGDNTFVSPFQFDFLAGVADGVSYGLAATEGDIYVPLFTASQTVAAGGGQAGDGTKSRFPDGSALSYERWFFVGHGDVGSITDQFLQARGLPHGRVSGRVIEEGTGESLTGVDVFAFRPGEDGPWTHFRTDVHPADRVADGSFEGLLPVGKWELLVHDRGRPEARRVPIQVKAQGEVEVLLTAPRQGVLDFVVRDETGRKVPSKVTLYRLDREPRRDPMLGDGFIAGNPESVVFALYGEGQVELAPGRYQAVATRGLEYEIDISEPFTIGPQQGAQLELQVLRSVNTDGWISADLHVHAERSHDSGVTLADRVRTMVAEGIEFFASTDHDYLVDYAPTVELLGVEEWVQTAVGNEITTLEVGHFLGFPLQQDFLGEAGADRDRVDWTDKRPAELIADLRSLGADGGFDPVIFIGHPRDGILGYFDQYGFDPYGGTPGRQGNPGQPAVSRPTLSLTNPLLDGSNMTWDFHGLELLNAKRLDMIRTPTQRELDRLAAGEDVGVYELFERTLAEQDDLANGVYKLGSGIEGHLDDWFTLLNLGFRFTVLGNSDTHGETSTEAGCPRNYIMSDTDDPAFLDDQAVADAVKAHRVVASYGPFVQMWVNGEPIGSELVTDGPIEITLDVQAPTWMDVGRVELYENGTLIAEWDVEDAAVVERFTETLTHTPERDSWYVAVVMGSEPIHPAVFTPVEIPYVELQLVVSEALGGIEAVSNLLSEAPLMPRQYDIYPYAVTNPIWVDRAGDGFDAPGLPSWLQRPD